MTFDFRNSRKFGFDTVYGNGGWWMRSFDNDYVNREGKRKGQWCRPPRTGSIRRNNKISAAKQKTQVYGIVVFMQRPPPQYILV